MSAEEVIKLLDLKPHPKEGGFFRETYRGQGTAIYYLIVEGNFSEMHRLPKDEMFHFYMGDPVEMLQLFPDGSGKIINIGTDLNEGMKPQVNVEKGTWQGTKLKGDGKWALLGTTLDIAFEYSDYLDGKREELINSYPDFKDLIISLTR